MAGVTIQCCETWGSQGTQLCKEWWPEQVGLIIAITGELTGNKGS